MADARVGIRLRWGLVAALALLMSPCRAQDIPQLKLVLRGETPVPTVFAQGILDPIKCDSKDNVYIRPWIDARVLAAPILKISPEGKREAVFSLDGVEELEEFELHDFAVAPGGELYALVGNWLDEQFQVLLVSFDDDGSYASTITLEPVFQPAQLAVFPAGQFLISGSRPLEPRNTGVGQEPGTSDQKRGLPLVKPYAAIFDRSGRVFKELSFEGDARLAADAGGEEQGGIPTEAISLGRTVTGEDGNVYVLRVAARPLVYVVSPTGRAVRTLEITPPSEHSRVIDMKWAGGSRLVLQFAEKVGEGRFRTLTSTFSVVNAETGETLFAYLSGPKVGGALACAGDRGLTFLGSTEDGHLAIRRVAPR